MRESITITINTTVYCPWLESQDEPCVAEQRTDHHVIYAEDIAEAVEFGDSAAEYVASILTDGRGSDCWAVYASESPTVTARTWYSAKTYEDPFSGHRSDVTYHLDGPDWTDKFAADVADVAKWRA